MLTENGREITYKEALEMKLLDNVRLVDLFRSDADVPGQGDKISVRASKGTQKDTNLVACI